MVRLGESKASEKRIAAAEKRRDALELRKAGHGYQYIADQLGYASASGAYNAIKAALSAVTKQPAQELRDLEVERLDALLEALWPTATSKLNPDQFAAVDRVLKIQERRAKLLGLDAPEKVEEVGSGVRREVLVIRDSGRAEDS